VTCGLRLTAAAVALLAGACASTTHEAGRVRVHEFLFGLSGGAALDVRDLCPSGQARELAIERSFSTYLIGVVTLGIYVPFDVRVRCSGPESTALEPAAPRRSPP
jgi:hypothetical protein